MTDTISRADAVKVVRKELVCDGRHETHDKTCRFIADVLLSALPSAEAKGDLISRDVVLANIRERLRANGYGNVGLVSELNRLIGYVRNIPSAEDVQGEWEHWGSPFSDESEVIDTIVCSVCGARFIEPKDEPKGEYNFCPSCGARMKGGEQNDD